MSRNLIVLLGANGNLGKLIAEQFVANPNVHLRVLVRPESRQKLVDLVGAEIRNLDVATASPAELKAGFEDASCVVSALQGGPEIIINAQGRLLDAAKAAGVARFIASAFSYDIFGPKPGQNFMTDQRRIFAEDADDRRGAVEVVNILIGCFMDKSIMRFIGALDFENAVSRLWGDGREKMDFTTYADTAAYTAAVATDDRPRPRVLSFAGSTLDFHEVVATFARESGRAVSVEQMGSLSDLSAEIDKRLADNPADFMAYIPLMYWRSMLNGSGKLKSLSNTNYPHIKPMSFDKYAREYFA